MYQIFMLNLIIILVVSFLVSIFIINSKVELRSGLNIRDIESLVNGTSKEISHTEGLDSQAEGVASTCENNSYVLRCEVCRKMFIGELPKYCCNNLSCGCEGKSIEPVCCSEKCYNKLGWYKYNKDEK